MKKAITGPGRAHFSWTRISLQVIQAGLNRKAPYLPDIPVLVVKEVHDLSGEAGALFLLKTDIVFGLNIS